VAVKATAGKTNADPSDSLLQGSYMTMPELAKFTYPPVPVKATPTPSKTNADPSASNDYIPFYKRPENQNPATVKFPSYLDNADSSASNDYIPFYKRPEN